MGDHYWHIHHEVLFEEATEPIDNRISYIKNNKPRAEIATRIRLLKPVKDQARLLAIISDRDAAIAPARKTYDAAIATARKTYDAAIAPARKTYYAAIAPAEKTYDAAIAKLHETECPDCPWDGTTIFPPVQTASTGGAA